MEATITELRQKLDQLDEFRSKRATWIDQEEAHKAERYEAERNESACSSPTEFVQVVFRS